MNKYKRALILWVVLCSNKILYIENQNVGARYDTEAYAI